MNAGRPSLFTREQHQQALDWFRAQHGRRGACADLARRYGITQSAMSSLLKRAAFYELQSKAVA